MALLGALGATSAATATDAVSTVAGEASCASLQTVLPDPAQCSAAYQLDSATDQRARLDHIYRQSIALADKNRLGEAARALDCAEAVAGAYPAPAIAEELLRRRGVIEFRRECPLEALALFKRALAEAERGEDRRTQAKNWSNIGSSLRRLGDYQAALRAQITSLELWRRLPDAEIARTLNNIADVYRDMGETDKAVSYYQRARTEHLRRTNAAEAAHVLEALGTLYLDAGDVTQAERVLLQARDELLQANNAKYLQRTYAELARAALLRNDLAAAAGWSASGLALVDTAAGEFAPAPLQLQTAQVERLRGDARAARERVIAALKTLATQDSDRPALLAELAADHEALSEWPQAMAALRESENAARQLRQARYDREMKWLQVRFETAERDRTIANLAVENRVRTLALWLTVVSALAALLGLTVFFLRRQHRARVAEAARRARLDEEIDYYRRAAAELGIDRARLQAALDSREDAVLVLDAAGQVLAANRRAGELLQPGGGAVLAGHGFGELLDEPGARAFAQALEHLDESSAPQRVEFGLSAGSQRLSAELSESGQGEGLIVLGLQRIAASAAAQSPAPAVEPMALNVEPSIEGDEGLRQSFRRALVELMLAVVEAWERSTGQGRLELAEKSRIWRVTVDDGRLRARAMERYLSLSKLPRQPRWRDVLRSGYYVLAECTLEEPVRSELQRHVDTVLTYTRRNALV
ncbi:tetratricopeptide repeat protein [Lysobacter sp. CA199]|uniref:tetratricopeptide repeat protein n=1 Tax=Lysobacter sp. CA199 TaxID=3455608 RepID=UPI003F8D4771